ncbi:MAG: thioredoxin domain-containing protein [Bacteriovoracaceae bacterium]|jgi:predicted DsbA family dithiol-disulfide isomerase|nr:thioredoxin domain-containing protein [Bacteriovoracaceae bacterium]
MKKVLSLTMMMTLFISCSTDRDFEAKFKKTLENNPSLVMQVIENNPTLFIETVQKAALTSKLELAKNRQKTEENKIEEAISKPLKPIIRRDEIIRGNKDAPITLVEYSDFECPFCKRGFETVKVLLKKYGGKIRFIYKHLPLSFHKSAKLSAEYYEAIRLENPKLASTFHDLVFDSQREISNGEPFLKKMAKQAGANMVLLQKNLKALVIQERIEQDIKEAQSFGLQGTPGFVLNGVPIKGAYPPAHFEKIIELLKSKGKLKI